MQSHQRSNDTKAQLLGLKQSIYYAPEMSLQAKKAIQDAKRRDRPIIKEDWSRDRFYEKNVTRQLFNCPDDVGRRKIEEFTIKQFREQYHRAKKAVIIKGCTNDWKTKSFWSHNNIAEQFANYMFKVGQDDDGNKIRIKMSFFIDYLIHNTDDSPLYLFENLNIVSQELKPLLNSYQIPPYFQDDVFKLLEDKDRPLFRWFLMGPERSGSTVHIDPLMTSAWNTSLVGHKRWVLFRPDTPKYIVKGKEFRSKSFVDEAINYFAQILPQIKKKYSKQTLGLVQFIQYPGQTVFVPSGVWHAVLNLDDTIAVTQNFLNQVDFQAGWEAILEQKKAFYPVLLQKLQTSNRQLYEKAQNITKLQEEQFSQSQPVLMRKPKSKMDRQSVDTEKDIFVDEQPIPRGRVSSDSKIQIRRTKQKTFSEKGSDNQQVV